MVELPNEIRALIERFERNIESYRSVSYKEAQLRTEFINPLFEALGWDVYNREGCAEAYKEVIHEDAIHVGGATKAPDYCFRIGGMRKFFVETKKPSVDITAEGRGEGAPAYQLRRYAWSAKLPLSILTDFEGFAVYDCRIRPRPNDKVSTARVFFCTYKEYPEKWEHIASIFSKKAVLQGSFDKYAESALGKRGTSQVDAEFLKEIEGWREALARHIALRNPDLSVRELNYAVQSTIDRIIFLRMAEDRGIEPYGQLQSLMNGAEVYSRLRQLYDRADERYNSGLFHFQKEKDRDEPPDELTPRLKIDDAVLRDIVKGLYYPESPYEFSVLGGDILGNVYEQFLGKVIRLTPGHQAKVEEKPEVKKAGGVYYTPSYIVDYIVKNTVGKLCEGKTDKQVAKLRVLDPACGSGSFLIGAYAYLLDWHRDRYMEEGPGKHPNEIYQGRGGQWYLTTRKKKEILLNNVYGVDIDSQAVEVTKLNLLLKLLEGENQDTLERQFKLFRERALPDLASNIKCGNSLIGPDFFQNHQGELFDDEDRYRINAFDWQNEFSETFKRGGFDAVIGNPPYGSYFQEREEEYLSPRFETFSRIKDLYLCFVEKGSRLLHDGGLLSFIVPSAWIGGPSYSDMRGFMLGHELQRIIMLPFDVFADAYIDTLVFVLSKNAPAGRHKVQTYVYPKRRKLSSIDLEPEEYQRVEQAYWSTTQDKKFILSPATVQLMLRLRQSGARTLADIAIMKRGVLFDRKLLVAKKASKDHYRYFEGDVYRYSANEVAKQWVPFGSKMKERPKELHWFKGKRILLRRLVNRQQRLMATITEATYITNKNLYTVKPSSEDTSSEMLLGILNSRLISYLYLNQVSQATKDDFPQVTIKDILGLPFPSTDKSERTKLAKLVQVMLQLQKKLHSVRIPADKTMLHRQIDATDKQIDSLVYELYGLSEEEVAIVEEATKKKG